MPKDKAQTNELTLRAVPGNRIVSEDVPLSGAVALAY
jgi:hypothetical protein